MQQQNKTAEELAKVLQKHPCIEKVHYPTVRYHRDYDVANRPGMFPCGFGGVISFEVKGDGNPWSQETFDATARYARIESVMMCVIMRLVHIPSILPVMAQSRSLFCTFLSCDHL